MLQAVKSEKPPKTHRELTKDFQRDLTVFAANMQALRVHVGFTQQDLADEAGVSVLLVSSIECVLADTSRRVNPTLLTLSNISEALAAELRDMFTPKAFY